MNPARLALLPPVQATARVVYVSLGPPMQCLCPALEMEPASQLSALVDNGVLASFGIWLLMFYVLQKVAEDYR